GDRHAEPGHGDGDGDRQHCQIEVIADRHARLVGELGDEMSRPDAGTEHEGRSGVPIVARIVLRVGNMSEEVAGGKAGEEAEQPGKYDETQIVLLDDAGVNNVKHRRLWPEEPLISAEG